MILASSLGAWEWISGILLFILGISVLIALHELGHLLTAKMFKVYCHEYSIGFGPKIFSHKGKNKETTFSIRAIPLGGYVSMFGEEAKDEEEFKDIPLERSLEGIARWKRAIIFVAGVTMNFILGTLLILTSNLAFPQYANKGFVDYKNDNVTSLSVIFDEDSPLLVSDDKLKNDSNDFVLLPYVYDDQIGGYYIVEDNIIIPGESNENKYVLVSFPRYKTTSSPIFSSSLGFYLQSEESVDLIRNNEVFTNRNSIHKPLLNKPYTMNVEMEFDVNMAFRRYENSIDEIRNETIHLQVQYKNNSYSFVNIGMKYKIVSYYLDFGTAFVGSFKQFGTLFVRILEAVGGLFTGKTFGQIGGVVAIAASVSEYNANYGFGMFLFYMGFLSINLGIFNLIPFPGLDGWSLLVLAVEGITRKKIPQKVKGIVSIIGLVLLFGLMIFVVVKDIVGLII